MSETPVSVRRRARARNASPARQFADDPLRVALVTALRYAFDARRKEEGLTQHLVGTRSGCAHQTVSKVLLGRRKRPLIAVADGLDLRLELAFVDRKHPWRRFTPQGVEYLPDRPAATESGSGAAIAADVPVRPFEVESVPTRTASGPRRMFSAASMQLAVLTALRHSYEARKAEDGWTHEKLAQACGRTRSAITAILAGRDLKMSTISDLAEGLGLHLEFSFADRWKPGRRFTLRGAEWVQGPASGPLPQVKLRRQPPDTQA